MVIIKRMKRRTTSGKVVIRHKRRKTDIAKCARCKRPLHGVPSLHAVEIGKLTKSGKRPSRAYGGYLCSACTRELLKEKVRNLR